MPDTEPAASLADSIWWYVATYGVKVVGVVVFLLAAWILASWLRRTVRKGLLKAEFDPTLGRFISNLLRWIILILAILACLGTFGFQTTSFAALIGAAGLAIGLAFQGSLSNLAAGIMLLIFRPFKVADLINVAGQLGNVNEIDLFMTEIDTLDGRRVIIPNSQIFGNVIENLTHHPRRRVDVPVGVSYSADLDRTKAVLEAAVRRIPGALADPAPVIWLDSLGSSSVNWVLRVWTLKENFGEVRQATVRAAKMALDEAGISIPFPQMDVHLFKQGS